MLFKTGCPYSPRNAHLSANIPHFFAIVGLLLVGTAVIAEVENSNSGNETDTSDDTHGRNRRNGASAKTSLCCWFWFAIVVRSEKVRADINGREGGRVVDVALVGLERRGVDDEASGILAIRDTARLFAGLDIARLRHPLAETQASSDGTVVEGAVDARPSAGAIADGLLQLRAKDAVAAILAGIIRATKWGAARSREAVVWAHTVIWCRAIAVDLASWGADGNLARNALVAIDAIAETSTRAEPVPKSASAKGAAVGVAVHCG